MASSPTSHRPRWCAHPDPNLNPNRDLHNGFSSNLNPNPIQVCDDSEPFGCRRYAAAGTPEGGDAVMAARAFKERVM